jgi:hypothetical protein
VPYPTDHSERHKFAFSEGFGAVMGNVAFAHIRALKTKLQIVMFQHLCDLAGKVITI